MYCLNSYLIHLFFLVSSLLFTYVDFHFKINLYYYYTWKASIICPQKLTTKINKMEIK